PAADQAGAAAVVRPGCSLEVVPRAGDADDRHTATLIEEWFTNADEAGCRFDSSFRAGARAPNDESWSALVRISLRLPSPVGRRANSPPRAGSPGAGSAGGRLTGRGNRTPYLLRTSGPGIGNPRRDWPSVPADSARRRWASG